MDSIREFYLEEIAALKAEIAQVENVVKAKRNAHQPHDINAVMFAFRKSALIDAFMPMQAKAAGLQ